MEFAVLEPYNSIPMRSLAAEQTAEVFPPLLLAARQSLTMAQMIKVAAKAPPQRALQSE
jgi:hypothetical protein